ncbi:MAG: NAD(P)H-dependent oxidoreductase [Betaproteobacteria bacterium]|nr:NAD(P)H-dependent oxidoreductase [Betaproteobacteria bacterium]
MSNGSLNVVGICGSLRAASYNRMALQVAGELMPAGMSLTMFALKDIPFFDADVMAAGMPPAVAAMREAVRKADGVLLGSPEYNFSVSGVLKNAIDWLSRGTDQPFNGKPYAIISATQGPLGGARSQYDLRKMLQFLNAHGLNKPEIFIGGAQNKFDAAGKLNDEPTRKIMGEQMVAFRDYIQWVKRGYGQT